ncbi:MAG TPA: hypothetical protein VLB47_03755, partial [Solirubrobacteraceae bacterium]|nr:hypothetical protein [Solirubrobacteraceae bacterium]
AHLVALDPPACAAHAALLRPRPGRTVHLAWGDDEAAFALRVLERDHDLRAPLAALYRELRAGGPAADALRRAGPARTAARLLRVLCELGLVAVDRAAGTVAVPAAARTDLERSPTYRASAARLAEGRRRLGDARPDERRAVAAATRQAEQTAPALAVAGA